MLNEAYDLRIATYNVRYDSMPDNITVKETIAALPQGIPDPPSAYYQNLNEQPWSTRRIHVANDILRSGAQIYGGQELLLRQVNDMHELLGSSWSWIGIGRDPKHLDRNEYNPIFYRNHGVELKTWDTFWLSQTPFEPSKVSDAGSYRICTTARFTTSKGSFTVINTHLDDQSNEQRALGASLILHRAKYEAIKTKRPVLLTGDFNSPQDDEAYRIMTGGVQMRAINETFRDKFSWTSHEGRGFENFFMKDLLGETPRQHRSGNYATFTHWAQLEDASKFQRLDYIFVGSTDGWAAKSYHVGQSLYDDGIYASDHRPVFADIAITASKHSFHPVSLLNSMLRLIYQPFR